MELTRTLLSPGGAAAGRRGAPGPVISWGLGLLIVLAACRLGDLLEAPPSGALAISPGQLGDSATIGSTIPREREITVGHAGTRPIEWTATHAPGRAWLTLSPASGTTPTPVMVQLNPTNLDTTGVYRDTIVFIAERPEPDTTRDTTRVSVAFRIRECSATPLPLGPVARDSLGSADCPAPHRSGHFARIYSFTGDVDDSVSVFVGSADFDAYVQLSTTPTPGVAPIAEADGCGADAGDACLRLVRLPQSGTFYIEATTAGPSDGGVFVLQASEPRVPEAPTRLAQLKSDGTTPIPAGGETDETSVVVRAAVSDPDTMDALALDVEIQPVGTPFTGQPTATAGDRRSGATAEVRLESVPDGDDYRWRARTRDASGRSSPWVEFGGNAPTDPDFSVAVPAVRLDFTVQPTTATTGQPIAPPVKVTALDASGQPAGSFTGRVTITLSPNAFDAKLSGTTEDNAVGGVATFSNLRVDKAGTGYTLVATASGLETATSEAFTVLPVGGGATNLEFTGPPGDAQTGQPVPGVEVSALDGQGDVDPNYTGTVTIALGANASGGVLTGTSTRSVAAVAGVARFTNLRVDRPGTGYTLIAAAPGVDGDTSPPFNVADPPPPPPGNLTVTTATTGQDLDPNGYTVTVDASNSQAAPTSGTVTFPGLAAGDHSVRLDGVASNCTVGGANPRTVSVTAGATAQTTFTISCTALPPPTGNLTVTTATSGSDQDPDGYTVTLNGGQSRSIGLDESTTYTGLAAGSYSVELSGVASNCTVGGANPRTVSVTAGATAQTTFTITCTALPPPTGNLTVTTATSGSDQDPNGYTVSLNGGQSRSIGPDESTTYTGLAAGSYSVELSGVASNCTVGGANPRTVSVTAGATAQTTFTITCTTLPPPNQPPRVNAGPDETRLIGVLYTLNASFSDSDNDGPWTYTIDWGDGSSQSGTTSSQGSITATHSYFVPGSYRIRVTVEDRNGGRGSDELVLTVVLQ